LLHKLRRPRPRLTLDFVLTGDRFAQLISEHEGKDKNFTDYAAARLREIVDTTLTDDIRKIMAACKGPLTTSDVREELNKLGGSMAEQSNPLATINAILNRLHEQGYVKETVKDGRKAWERRPVSALPWLRPKGKK
jgi:hypothetical protein